MNIKKFAWERMPTLNVRALGDQQITALAEAYDVVAYKELSPIAALSADKSRADIDDAIAGVIGLPDLNAIRALLAMEPGLTAVELSPRDDEKADDIEED